MSELHPLPIDALYHRCDPSQLGFSNTSELEDIALTLGQHRALRAVRFGLGIRQPGYNLFVLGEFGAGKQAFVRQYLAPRLAAESTPPDWCYVYNFDDPTRPRALGLPNGRGHLLRNDVDTLVSHALTSIQFAFDSADYLASAQAIDDSAARPHERANALAALNIAAATQAIEPCMDDTRAKYADLPLVQKHLAALRTDILTNCEVFAKSHAFRTGHPFVGRYRVNVIVAHGKDDGAPLVYESHPILANLFGKYEVQSHDGARALEATFIKAGSLQRANGGYLLIDAMRLLAQPSAWEALKRTLATGKIKIESEGAGATAAQTIALDPEPIPLNLKVVLLGDQVIYQLLSENDPEFLELFKVVVDFEEDMDRSPDTTRLFAQMIGTLARQAQLKPFAAEAVARLVEHASRLAEDAHKISIHVGEISDLVREADFWAGESEHDVVQREDVDQAISEQEYRSGRVREHVLESIERGQLLVDSDDTKIGQINGLTVLEFGNQLVGQPARITATTRLGEGKIVDIEREVELGGAIHSKGVLILSHYIAARYARNKPLSLSASVVFEQSYAQIEGDSASLAELAALLSAIAETPLNQGIAVTGSVNQLGEVQPIGGINEKIEGFFDVCAARGLTGTQGVIIPHSNATHLMLRADVVEAATKGIFHIFAVKTIDETIALLSGLEAGARDNEGNFPEDSFNFRVEVQLLTLAELWQVSGDHPSSGDGRE